MSKLLWAFLVRDFYEETSYRLSFALGVVGLFFNAFTFFFLSRLVGNDILAGLQSYDTDYFSFALIGIAFNAYFGVGLSGFARALRRAQNSGTLEALIMTPAPLSLIVTGSAAWTYVYTTLRMFIYLGLGALLGVSLAQANLFWAVVSLLLSIVAFASLGIMAAGIIMVIKRGDPVTSLMSYFATLLGGIYYPIEVLPPWLQTISRLLPITYAIEAMRLSLLAGAGWNQLRPNLLVLGGFCLVLFPLSLFVFRAAVEKARVDGSLTHY